MLKHTMRLQRYRWRGEDNQGRPQRGAVLAHNESDARATLQSQSIRLRRLTPGPVSLMTRFHHRMTAGDITLITRQLATMLGSGVPLLSVLQLLLSAADKAEVRIALSRITRQLESGVTLSDAMQASTPLFDELYINLLRSGELSGNLAGVFARLAQYREKSEQLRRRIIKALLYPAVVISVAMMVTYLMLSLVIPEFERLFSAFGSELPWFTRRVITLSHAVQSHGPWALLALTLVSSILYRARRRCQPLKRGLNRIVTCLPLVGNLLLKAALARFSRTLATSLSSGLPLLTSLQASSTTCGHDALAQAVRAVETSITGGMTLHRAMEQSKIFPPTMLQLVLIGEESGTLDDMLARMAAVYESDVDDSVDNLGKILEPALILLLGLVIGSLVVAMYLPIFNLMSVLG